MGCFSSRLGVVSPGVGELGCPSTPYQEESRSRSEARCVLAGSRHSEMGPLGRTGTEWHVRECDAYAGLESVGLSEFQSAWGGFRKIPQLTPWAGR